MAEVKVRITAQNETQTGFQAALTNAKKFGAEASRAASVSIPRPAAAQAAGGGGGGGGTDFKSFYDDAIQKAEATIEANLAKRKAAREAAAQSEKALNQESIAGAMGVAARFALVVTAAVAVGKAISMAFERVSDTFKAAAALNRELAATVGQAGSATSLSGAISGFQQLNDIADRFKQTREEAFGESMGSALANAAQGSPGQLMARSADAFLSPFGMGGAEDLRAQEESARQMARQALAGSLARQATNASALLGAGGNTEEIKKIAKSQANAQEIEDLKTRLELSKQDAGFIDEQIAQVKARQAAEATLTEQIRQRNLADKAAAMRQQNAEAGMTPQELLAKEQQRLAKLDSEAANSGRFTNEAAVEREEAIARIAQLEKAITAENERQVAANNSVAARAQAMREANAETAATQGLSDSELLARQQAKLAALDQSAMESGRYSNEDQIEREAILQNILGLEERIKQTREAAQKSLSDAIEDRQFAGMSPAEQQAQIARDQATLLSDIEGGNITDAEAAQRAMELARRQDALANGGFQGSSGASALQRVGLASNEFFDTRRAKDPAAAVEAGNKILTQIKDALSKGEPLVLNPTSS
jgi:hypothetical protein